MAMIQGTEAALGVGKGKETDYSRGNEALPTFDLKASE